MYLQRRNQPLLPPWTHPVVSSSGCLGHPPTQMPTLWDSRVRRHPHREGCHLVQDATCTFKAIPRRNRWGGGEGWGWKQSSKCMEIRLVKKKLLRLWELMLICKLTALFIREWGERGDFYISLPIQNSLGAGEKFPLSAFPVNITN